jgi:glyoxylase-like metal-dependent hydrolase (beta-lactamase superfamily II)
LISNERPLGAARVAVLTAGSFRLRAAALAGDGDPGAIPDFGADGRAPAGFNSLCIRIGGATVMVDPVTFHEFDPDGWVTDGLIATAGIDAALAELEVDPATVSHVLITHRHIDHVKGTVRLDGRLRFPNARHWLHRADWEALEKPAPDDAVAQLRRLADEEVLELVDQDTEVLPGVSILHTPGETAGHCVARLESEGEVAYYIGDVIHHSSEVEHIGWATFNADRPSLMATRLALYPRMARERALVAFMHAVFPGWGAVVESPPGAFRWEPR